MPLKQFWVTVFYLFEMIFKQQTALCTMAYALCLPLYGQKEAIQAFRQFRVTVLYLFEMIFFSKVGRQYGRPRAIDQRDHRH